MTFTTWMDILPDLQILAPSFSLIIVDPEVKVWIFGLQLFDEVLGHIRRP